MSIEYNETSSFGIKQANFVFKKVPFIPHVLRRVILSETPCCAIKIDTSKLETKYTIHKNDSTFKNQILMLRIAQVAHCFSYDVIESWVPESFKCVLKVSNKTNSYKKVYSSDISVHIIDNSASTITWLPYHKTVFPPDALTKCYTEITALPPHSEVDIEWYPEIGNCYDHAAFTVSSNVKYSHDDTTNISTLSYSSECGMSNTEILDAAFNKIIEDVAKVKRVTKLIKVEHGWEVTLKDISVSIGIVIQSWITDQIVNKKCKVINVIGYSETHPLERSICISIGANAKTTESDIYTEFSTELSKLLHHLDDVRLQMFGLIKSKLKVKSISTLTADTIVSDSSDVDEDEIEEDHSHAIAGAGLNLIDSSLGYAIKFDEQGQVNMEKEFIRAREYRNLIKKFAAEIPKYMDITSNFLLRTTPKKKLSQMSDIIQRCLLSQVWYRSDADIDPLFIYHDNSDFRNEFKSNMITTYKAFCASTNVESLKDSFGNNFKVHNAKVLEMICAKLSTVLLKLIANAANNTKALIQSLTIVQSKPVVKFISMLIDKKDTVVPVITWHTGNKRIISSFDEPLVGVHSGIVVIRYTGPKELIVNNPWATITSFFRYNYIEIGNQSLQKDKDEIDGIDGFSTPFNTHNPYFCSGYPDIDGPLGALAEFSKFCEGVIDGSFDLSNITVRHFAVNPPFVEFVMNRCADLIVRMLKAEKERGHKWTCSYIIPKWHDSPAYKDMIALTGLDEDLTVEVKERPDMLFRNAFEGESGINLGKVTIVQALISN